MFDEELEQKESDIYLEDTSQAIQESSHNEYYSIDELEHLL